MFKRKILEEKPIPLSPNDFVEFIVKFYDSVTQFNEGRTNGDDPFFVAKIPNITLKNYLNRIIKYGLYDKDDANSALTIAFIYIDRLRMAPASYVINNHNIHRLMLTSFLVGQKIFCDQCWSNRYIARVGGISLPELNKLERNFLSIIDYNLFITREEFFYYQQFIVSLTTSSTPDSANSFKRPKLT